MSDRLEGRVGRLTEFSLRRRITVFVLFVSVIVVGMVAASGIPLELIPRGYDNPFLGVVVPWNQAPAPEVLEKITIPLEEELSTVRGVQRMASYSRTGRGWVWLAFKYGTDMDVAYREVRDRVERARVRFPDDVDRVYIRKHDEAGIPVAAVGVAVDPSLTDSYSLIQNEIVKPLERIDGVATIGAEGLMPKEILIELDRERMEAAGFNIHTLAQQLGDDNFSLASGRVRDGSRKLLLRSVARFETVDQLRMRPIGPNLRLGDIARITYDEAEKNFRIRVNSKPAFALMVFKEGQANTIEVSTRVHEAVERARDNPRLQGVEMMVLFSQGEVITESLSTLFSSGRIGALFAIGILFVFLRRVRMTAIITLSIPVSILIGLAAMYFAGETLNILTLLGLMISVGLLVDNSVVVAENIYRLHREGVKRRDACIKGAGEIALAITTATLTTIVVFLPVALVEGNGQFFLLRLAIPITVSLSASLLVALVFVPLAVYLTLPRNGTGRTSAFRRFHDALNERMRWAYDASMGRLNRYYTRMLAFFLERRLDLTLCMVVLFVLTGAVAFREVEMTEAQEDERSGFEIDIEFPRTTTLEETEEYFARVEKVIDEHREEWGLEGYFIFHRARWGELEGWFTNPRTTDLTAREVTKLVQEVLPEKPGIKIYTGQQSEIEENKSESLYSIVLRGEDWRTLESTAKDLEEYLAELPGVLGIQGSQERPSEELALRVDSDRTQRYQVNPEVVAGVVGYALRGRSLPRFRDEGREIPVRIRFQEEDRDELDKLGSFAVPTATGGTVPLSSVVSAEITPTYRGIFRRNKQTAIGITLELEQGRQEEKTRKLLDAITASMDLPEGITMGGTGRRAGLNEDLASMQFAAILSVLFIYLLMGFLFESFILPLSIILTIPLAFIGVGWIHYFTGRDLDFLGVVGSVLLIGVVVNNGIVLVDYVIRLRAAGMARTEAMLRAADLRFRPIMMTALTTIFGMIPLTFGGQSTIGISYTSFGLTLIGGMTTATLLTLLVVPVFYTLFDDARAAIRAAALRAFPALRAAVRPGPAPASPAPESR